MPDLDAIACDARVETAASHQGLEHSLDIFTRVRTKADYGDLLKKFFTLYEPLERQLAAVVDWSALGWNFSERLKTLWLREDLLALGMSLAELDAKPRWTGRVGASVGEAIGVLYVLEGSALGGQLIAKHFRETLGIAAENGGKFFRGEGESTGRNWRAFGAWAEAQNAASRGELEPQAVAGARRTFDIFAQWLAK